MLYASLVLLQEEHTPGPLSVDPGLMIWTLLIFAALLLILRRFAWPAILGAVAEAERSRAEAAQLLAEHKKLMGDAKAQAHAIVVEARQLAEKERAVAMEKTKQEQDELLQRARREISEERDRAVADLRREAVDLSLAAAGKLIGERLGNDTDRKIVTDYLASLDSGR